MLVTVPETVPVIISGGEILSKKQGIFLGSIVFLGLLIGILCFQIKGNQVAYKNYEGRVFYEIFVRAFNDTDQDGIGDLKGVTAKLDYLEELGIRGIWLMPITKATSYHGYDTEDYYTIDEDYGTLEDLKELIKEAHKRDIKIVMDLVINHTSNKHPYFIEASENENSPYRDYYIWSEDMEKKNEKSPMSTLAWVQNGNNEELYYAIFDKGMPDLNFDNPKVEEEMQEIAKYYLDIGIDGFRLDAAKWIYNTKDKNIEFWDRFQEFVHTQNKEALLIAEVWDNPYNISEYASVFNSFFSFNIGESILKGVRNKELSTIVDEYMVLEERYKEKNEDFVVAPFLTNHDQDRIMSMLEEDKDKMKIASAIYLTLPGTPFVYYGEETGMLGTKPDEHIREPFIWSEQDQEKNTSWITSTNPLKEVALENQIEDMSSLYNHYKQLINLRNTYKGLSIGSIEKIETSSWKIYATKRVYKDETIYILASLDEKEETINLEEGTYKVLYTNQPNTQDLSNYINQITLKEKDIYILLKAR